MNDDIFTPDTPIPFKALADKISRALTSSKASSVNDADLSEEEILEELFRDDKISVFTGLLKEELSKPSEHISDEEIYEEITDNYFVLIREAGIDGFSLFRFKDYDDCRVIIIDGKEYDLDGEFCHDDLDATGSLCAIDCLIGDLGSDCVTILKRVEKMINIRNRNQ